MSDRRIIFTNPDGSVGIIIPADNTGLTVEQVAAKDVTEGLPYEIVSVSQIPSDRTFRDAWCPCAVNKLRVDVNKAKGICHEKRRMARKAEFAPLDVQATIPAKAAEAEAKRQAIRDKYDALQASIDAAATADELKAIVTSLPV